MPADLPDIAPCPDHQTLADFHAGRLPDPDLEAIATHLSRCTACETALSGLERASGDVGLSARIRRCLELPAPVGPAFAATMDVPPGGRSTGGLDLFGGSSGPMDGRLDGDPPTDTPADPAVGPYRLLGKIAKGGMGVVFRAEHRELGRPTALKVIRPDRPVTAHTRSRFRVEAKSAARLQHENIVRLYDFGEHAGHPYFGMEFVAGGSLANRLADGGPLGFREAAELVRTLATAMAYAHGKGVIHRDLKPANVLMDGDTPKIADFGLAKWVGDPADGSVSPTATAEGTLDGQVVGTPAYMAVEQAEGRVADVTPATDVWALGVILYECLTGRLPFEGRDKDVVLALVRECDPVWPTVRKADVPADLEAVCLKCLDRDPQARYASAGDLAADLGRWLAGDPTLARPLTRRQRAARWVRKRSRRVAAAAGVLALLAGAAAAGAMMPWNKAVEPARRAWEKPGTLPAASPDAEKAWAGIEQKLARRETVTLVGEKGPPAYYRAIGTIPVRFDLAADGAFAVTGGPAGLVELAPATKADCYRLRAQVRHESSTLGGVAGLYFAHQSAAGADGPHHLYGCVLFNDVISMRQLAIERLGDQLRPNQISWNHLRAEVEHLRFVATRPAARLDPYRLSTMHLASGDGFDPPADGTTWRDIAVVVTPTGAGVKLGDMAALELPAEKVRAACADRARDIARQHPDDPGVKAIRPEYTPTGGVGLIVRDGTASVRSVRLEALPDKP